MNKAFCRIFQAAMKVGMKLLPWSVPDVIEGPGSTRLVGRRLKDEGIDKALVVMGGHMMKRGLPVPMLESMDGSGVGYVVFDSLTADPTDRHVDEGVEAYISGGCQAVVMFGGGSPMDCGKAIAARVARPGRTVSQLQGVLKVRGGKRMPFMLAVPTTSGTGSEATMAAVISDSETHRKRSINDISLIPDVCVLDAELTEKLPPDMTAYTGMDALCHAVEAYTNGTYNTERENDMARRAVGLVHDFLYRAYLNGSDTEARRNMQKAAFFAGRAFTRGCVGYVHAIGHAVGGLYGIPHGKAMAVLLPVVMRAYGEAAERRLAELADVCGCAPEGVSDSEKAAAFIRWTEELNDSMGIPRGFDCVRAEDIPVIAEWADEEANPLYPVPKIFDKKELTTIIRGGIIKR